MPLTHRNLLVVMIVGCVWVLGTGKAACAFDGVTFHFIENTDHTAVPPDYWDHMYFMIGGGGAYGPINSNGTALNQNTSYRCSTYPWVTIADPITNGGLYICFDPEGTGINNPNNKPILPGDTNSPGYNKRWQYFEFSSDTLDVSVVESYGLPLKVGTFDDSSGDETLRVSFASTDKEIRQALHSSAKTPDKAQIKNNADEFVRYLSPKNCFEKSNNHVWPDFSDYLSSLISDHPCAKLAYTIEQYVPDHPLTCSGHFGGALQWNLNVTISQSNDIYTANLNGTVNSANLTAPIKFSGSATEWTSAIYQQITADLTVDPGSATLAQAGVVFQDLSNGFIMGMYGSQQSWKLNPANPNCPNTPCCGAIKPVPYSPLRPVFIADSNPDDSSKIVANLESAAWYWTAPDAVFTNPLCSKWDKIMQQNGNSSVFSWTLKNAWSGKGELAQFPVTSYCTVMVQSLTKGPVTCNGDLNGSFNTDIDDLLLMVEGWGTTHSDVTGDGFSDIEDLLVVLGDYGCDHR